MDYSKDKEMYNQNKGNHNPNAGENQVAYSGSTGGSRPDSIIDSAGVADGLSSMAPCSVKDAEMVTANQRPESNTMKVDGSFTIGVS